MTDDTKTPRSVDTGKPFTIDELLDERYRLRVERDRLRGLLEGITTVFEAAVRHHETKDQGGQQVPFHGDFGHVPPSVVARMRWWATEFRAALSEEGRG